MQSYVSFGRNGSAVSGTDCRCVDVPMAQVALANHCSSSLHVQIRMIEEKPLAKAIEPVAVGRENQNKGLIVAHESGECDCLSIHPAGEEAVGLRLTYTGVPRTRNGRSSLAQYDRA